jgi:hypothetical protein
MLCGKCGKHEGIVYWYYRGKKTGETHFPVDSSHERVTTTYEFDPLVRDMSLCSACVKRHYTAMTGLLLLALAVSFGLWFVAGHLNIADGDEWVTAYLLLKFISGGGILILLTVLLTRLADLPKKRLYGRYAQQMAFGRAKRLPENRGYDTFVSPERYMELSFASRFR